MRPGGVKDRLSRPAAGLVVWILASVLVAAGPGRAESSNEPDPGLIAERSLEPDPGLIAELPFLDVPDPSSVVVDLAPEVAARRLPLVLDTGAMNSMMTPGRARELGVNVRRQRTTPHRRATRLGRDLHFWVETRWGDRAGATGREFGLLGGNFLSHFVVEIDYAARRVRFFDPALVSVPEQTTAPDTCVVPLRLVANRPHLELRVADQPIRVLVDTGAFAGLLLGKRDAKRAGIAARPVPGLSAVGVRGPIVLELGSAGEVALGSFHLRELPVLVAPRGLYQQAGDTDSVLGHDILALHRVRIDYPRRRLLLERRGSGAARLLGEPWDRIQSSGVGLAFTGTVAVVRFVLPGGAGARLGIQPEDLIRLDGDSPAMLHQRIATGASLRVERLDDRGREVEHRLGGAAPPP